MTRSWTVVLVACAQLLSGCSVLFTRRPALPAEADEPVRCTESRAAPIADTVVTGALFTAAAALIANGIRTDNEGIDCASCYSYVLAALPLAYGGVMGLTAMVGYSRTDRCKRVHGWQARCLGGDREACAALQGDPAAPPPEAPR